MADFTYPFSAQATASPWTVPAPLIQVIVGGTSPAILNGTGVHPINANGVLSNFIAHNVNYNLNGIIQGDYFFPSSDAGTHFSDLAYAAIIVRSGANAGAMYALEIQASIVRICKFNPSGTQTYIGTGTTTCPRAAGDKFSIVLNPVTGALSALQNGAAISGVSGGTDTAYTSEVSLAPSIGFNAGSSSATYCASMAGTGVLSVTSVLGSMYARERPIGRGPYRGPNGMNFRRPQGSNAMRQVLLQMFSAPGVPIANTLLNFCTAYTEQGIAIDGNPIPIALATDALGFVFLQNLKINAGTIQVRVFVPGDPHRSENVTVTAV